MFHRAVRSARDILGLTSAALAASQLLFLCDGRERLYIVLARIQ